MKPIFLSWKKIAFLHLNVFKKVLLVKSSLCHFIIRASHGSPQSGGFGKVAFFIISMIDYNILKSKVFVHWIEPVAQFGRSV